MCPGRQECWVVQLQSSTISCKCQAVGWLPSYGVIWYPGKLLLNWKPHVTEGPLRGLCPDCATHIAHGFAGSSTPYKSAAQVCRVRAGAPFWPLPAQPRVLHPEYFLFVFRCEHIVTLLWQTGSSCQPAGTSSRARSWARRLQSSAGFSGTSSPLLLLVVPCWLPQKIVRRGFTQTWCTNLLQSSYVSPMADGWLRVKAEFAHLHLEMSYVLLLQRGLLGWAEPDRMLLPFLLRVAFTNYRQSKLWAFFFPCKHLLLIISPSTNILKLFGCVDGFGRRLCAGR